MSPADLNIIEEVQRGNSQAEYRLYRLCFPVLMGICTRYRNNHDEALAMVNEGFLKIIDNIDSYRPQQPFEAWIRRIMVNTLIDDFRRHHRYREKIQLQDFQDFHDDPGLIDFNQAELDFNAAELETMIHQLPPMSRKVFNLIAIDGYSHKEISELLGISEGTSKWHLSFARKKLQQLLLQHQKIHDRQTGS